MGKVLSKEKREQLIALGRLGWSPRRIEQSTGVRRETASEYLCSAGIPLRSPGGWGHHGPAKPAIEVTTDSDQASAPKPAIRVTTEELADATLDGQRKEHMELLSTIPLLIIDDLGMRKLPLTAAEELLEIMMRRYERASTLITSNRPVDDWGKLLGDSAAVSAMLDRLLHHGHVLKCGPRSWRTHVSNSGDQQ